MRKLPRWTNVIAVSLAITAAAALTALPLSTLVGTRYTVAFVVTRWILVATLLVTPLLHQALVRFGSTRTLPWALRTPATALVLTCESIALDIVSANLG